MTSDRETSSSTFFSVLRLATGTELREGDLYLSSSGRFESCPVPGLEIQPGCRTLWFRPTATFSDESEVLLRYLAATGFLLVRNYSRKDQWRFVPSIDSAHDGRMDWTVVNPEPIPNLIDVGLLESYPLEDEVYRLTPLARSLLLP